MPLPPSGPAHQSCARESHFFYCGIDTRDTAETHHVFQRGTDGVSKSGWSSCLPYEKQCARHVGVVCSRW